MFNQAFTLCRKFWNGRSKSISSKLLPLGRGLFSVASLFLFVLGPSALAQQPDCYLQQTWLNAQSTNSITNLGPQCTYWVFNYQANGFSALSIAFQSANGTAVTGAGTFGNFSGTVVTGSNPNTNTTGGTTVFQGYVGFFRVNLTSATGSGSISWALSGWRAAPAGAGGAPFSGCTVGVPCIEDTRYLGGTAIDTNSGNKSAGTQRIVLATDQPNLTTPFNTNEQQIGGTTVDTNSGNKSAGTQRIVLATDQPNLTTPFNTQGSGAAGAALTGNPFLQGWSDGANLQNAFFCPNQAAITLSAATDAVLVAGVSSKKTIVCHIDFVSNSAADFTIRQGTGATCGTSTATIAGTYPSIQGINNDYSPMAALRTTVNANDLCIHSSASVTVGGFITYAQF